MRRDPTAGDAMRRIARTDAKLHRKLTKAQKLINECMEDLRRR